MKVVSQAGTEQLEECTTLLKALGAHPIFDPKDIPIPGEESLTTLEGVIATLRQLIKEQGGRALSAESGLMTLLLLGEALTCRGRRTGRFTEAWEVVSRAVECFPSRPEPHELRCQVGLLRGERVARWYGETLEGCQRLLVLSPKNRVGLYSRALCRELPALHTLERARKARSRGDESSSAKLVEEAEESLNAALVDLELLLALAPELCLVRLHRARCLARLGRLTEAERDLERLVDLGSPGFGGCREPGLMLARTLVERAEIRAAQQRFAEALSDLSQAIERRRAIERPIEALLARRAGLALRAGAHEQAIEDSTALLGLQDDLEPLWVRAQALFALGRCESARADASRILRIEPANVEARFLRGRCAAALGAFSSALVDLEQCLEMRPAFEECQTLCRTLASGQRGAVSARRPRGSARRDRRP